MISLSLRVNGIMPCRVTPKKWPSSLLIVQANAIKSKDYTGEVRMVQDIRRLYVITHAIELLLLPNLEH
jgi:hypothetical protein